MATFRKQEDCPTSQQLLAYQLGDLGSSASQPIGRHLAACEFCTSEVAFYEHYPVARDTEDCADDAKMPQPLFDLAEALLNRRRGNESIDEMMKHLDAALHDRR
ncbi:MAG: hypothetical protein PSX80_11760 [bacterium]|nr:hypothetical protein [bacterium]